MAVPTGKSPFLEQFLEDIAGRSTAIKADVCIPAPLGCGGPATEFTSNLARKEYSISGFCQTCQNGLFT